MGLARLGHEGTVEFTLRVKITMTDGAVVEVEEPLDVVTAMMISVPNYGYRDPASSRFYPADSILTIEILPPPDPPKFSVN
jgi:hypothetical protein